MLHKLSTILVDLSLSMHMYIGITTSKLT